MINKKCLPFQNITRISRKIGYLKFFKRSIFSNNWKPYYFILTDVGLLRFEKYLDLKPEEFIPISGSETISSGHCDK